jgi:glutaredoxin 3
VVANLATANFHHIRTGVNMAVEIVTSEWCQYCAAAKKLLTEKGIEYEEIDIMDAFKLMAENQLRTVPQIFMDGELIPGGYEGLKGYLNAN